MEGVGRQRSRRDLPKLDSQPSSVGAVPKRLFDILIATSSLLLLSPVVFLIALGVKLTSPGPVLFNHARVGLGRKPFGCLKFRTMVDDAEQWLRRDTQLNSVYRENGFKVPTGADPRVTTFGHILRRTHLDELPQLINVIKGDLSIVGPRPIVIEELDCFPRPDVDRLLSVRPGIFGLWTAMGQDRVNYPERAQVELSYLDNRSVLFDLVILFRHVPVLLKGQPHDFPETRSKPSRLSNSLNPRSK